MTSLADYDYHLPQELIAQQAVEPRDSARLLVYRMKQQAISHHTVAELDQLLAPLDLMVLNRSKVIPARLFGHKDTGGAVEVLLVHQEDGPHTWRCLVRGKVHSGTTIHFGQSDQPASHSAVVEQLHADGERSLRFNEPALTIADQLGHVPLPPYIKRADNAADRDRYQTVWADSPGSVAAPTASLHFTPELLQRLDNLGVRQSKVDLAVGPGTFQPVQDDDVSQHVMHKEFCVCPPSCVADVAQTRHEGGRVIAIGTTVVRTLEQAAAAGSLQAYEGWTQLFVRPPYDMRVVDGLLTNFHLPRSTLLMLVASLCGMEALHLIYQTAITEQYRFYSYGDAMLILPE